MRSRTAAVALFGALAVVAAGAISFLAYSEPDALEHSLESYRSGGATESAGPAGEESGSAAPMPDCTTPGIRHTFLSNAVAGVVGTAVTFAVVVILAYALRAKKPAVGKDHADG